MPSILSGMWEDIIRDRDELRLGGSSLSVGYALSSEVTGVDPDVSLRCGLCGSAYTSRRRRRYANQP